MDNIIKEKLNIIWDSIKEYCVCVYLGGSSVIPFIHNRHDIDIVIVYDSKENGKQIRDILRFNNNIKQIRQELQNNYQVAIFGRPLTKLNPLNFWAYQDFQFLFGESDWYHKPDILNLKEEFLDIIRQGIKKAKEFYQREQKIHKALYHDLILYYYIHNNSYDLTEEQINNINTIHDVTYHPEYTEHALQLLDWLDVEVNSLKEGEAQ